MSKYQIIAPALSSMPWQERPDEPSNSPLWRWNENPIIGRNPIKGVARIFNSAVMPYEDAFVGVFRGEQTNGVPYIYFGRSQDGIHWDFDPDKIPFVDENGLIRARSKGQANITAKVAGKTIRIKVAVTDPVS